MLPDLRVVTIAVISTFLFAASVGFYTSSRLMSERKPRTNSLAAIEDHPLNRIALNWPEPVQPPWDSLNLDFAVTAKVQRNPVREVGDEPTNVRPKVAVAPPQAIQNNRAEPPVIDAPKVVTAKIEIPKIAPPKVEPAKIEPAKVEVPRVDVPKLELPQVEIPKVVSPKIEPPVIGTVAPPPLAMAPRAKPEDNLPTASIVQAPALNPNSEDSSVSPNRKPGQQQRMLPHFRKPPSLTPTRASKSGPKRKSRPRKRSRRRKRPARPRSEPPRRSSSPPLGQGCGRSPRRRPTRSDSRSPVSRTRTRVSRIRGFQTR